MPEIQVLFYQDDRGRTPVMDWLRQLKKKDRKAFAKCIARIKLLTEQGYELRRPVADILREGIYELRSRSGTVNYRILYFFHGRDIAILSHGLTKEKEVPDVDIKKAIKRKNLFITDPDKHTYTEE